MLFNSLAFLLAFLPAVIAASLVARFWWGNRGVLVSLAVASVLFVGYKGLVDVGLLLASMVINFAAARALLRYQAAQTVQTAVFVVAIAFNIALLAVVKIPALGFVTGYYDNETTIRAGIAYGLPIAISFYTFQQITFLSDVKSGSISGIDKSRYAAYVTFFPQLIAGPIVRWRDVSSQLDRVSSRLFEGRNVAIGLSMIALGLGKKVLLADQIREVVTPLYDKAAEGILSTVDAWTATYGFLFQVYFDFSAYSDIALGLALLFGVLLPVNFHSPLKSTSLLELARRWHITLADFFRDCVYVPLGGPTGNIRRWAPVMFLTLLLSGVWHGYGLTFVAWGAALGLLLVINRALRNRRGRLQGSSVVLWVGRWLTMTLFALLVVLIRSVDLRAACNVYNGLFSLNGGASDVVMKCAMLSIALVIVWGLPNVAEIYGQLGSLAEREASIRLFQPKLREGFLIGMVFGLVLVVLWGTEVPPQFIYFAF